MKKQLMLSLVAMAILDLPMMQHSVHAAEVPAKAYFTSLKDGDTVSDPIKVTFGLSGMKVAPAGTYEPNTGHFHLLIDTQLSSEEMKLPIASDGQHMHFGKAQTETSLTLSPGKHTLQLVMGDGNHMLTKPPVMSDIITVTVK